MLCWSPRGTQMFEFSILSCGQWLLPAAHIRRLSACPQSFRDVRAHSFARPRQRSHPLSALACVSVTVEPVRLGFRRWATWVTRADEPRLEAPTTCCVAAADEGLMAAHLREACGSHRAGTSLSLAPQTCSAAAVFHQRLSSFRCCWGQSSGGSPLRRLALANRPRRSAAAWKNGRRQTEESRAVDR